MDFTNEQYVRLYTRNTLTWKRLNWQAKAVFPLLLRALDRAGTMDLGDMSAAPAVAVAIEIPLDVVEAAIPCLLDLGVIEIHGEALVVPRFLEGQECIKSDKLRAKEYRERKRSQAMAGPSQNVTNRHEESRDERNVTARHALLNSALPSELNLPELRENARAPEAPSVPEEPPAETPPMSEPGLGKITGLLSGLAKSWPGGQPQIDRPKSPEAVGLEFVASLLGRCAFDVAPAGSFRAEYAWLASRPAEERKRVAFEVNADPWCQANPKWVDAKHLQRSWQKYLAGPAKPVLLRDPEAEAISAKKAAAYAAQREADRERDAKLAAEAMSDEETRARALAARALVVSKLRRKEAVSA